MDRNAKTPRGGSGELFEAFKPVIAVGTGVGLIEGAGASMRVGAALYGGPEQEITHNPAGIVFGLLTGHLEWTTPATLGAVTLVAGGAGLMLGGAWGWGVLCEKCSELAGRRGRTSADAGPLRARKLRKKERQGVDERAAFMARGADLHPLTARACAAKAAELGVPLRPGDLPGVLIGRAVFDGIPLLGSFEDLHVDIWGPRQGKSTSRVIPAILDAVGPVVSTSNKRDVVDATRTLREKRTGGRSWVFDPQAIAGEAPNWYWNPSEWIWGADGAGAEIRATRLAGIFAAGTDSDKGDPFFEPEGEDLLAALFLAAAAADLPITRAYEWVTDPTDPTPVKILSEAGTDFASFASSLRSHYKAPDKQRAGVFSTAKKMSHALKFGDIRQWVTPGTDPGRPSFDPAAFVRSKDTLFLLSGEGSGNAGPLITGLAAAIAEAGAEEGNRHGGRLPVPLTLVLDEAANIVRWPDLPKQYSHFGSRGIVVLTVLQSWSQGVTCWGEKGMSMLWSAANIKVLGSGLDDTAFLRDRSESIGDHYEWVSSISESEGRRSVSTSRTTERTMTPSDLIALPRGRAVVFTSGRPAVLAVTVPWMERDYAPQVREALREAARIAAAAPRPERSAAPVQPPTRLRVVHTDPPPYRDDDDFADYDEEGRSA
ncbi:type IV secretory system conjugative DNA transfer family protein [Nocardia thailandica]|uniref:Type IV secretory system conjugative DNA transfer family protein n=1 Tax=Nocardia thailandica TaxID=257275 RepID=A0ABW6PWQ0_9NOCA